MTLKRQSDAAKWSVRMDFGTHHTPSEAVLLIQSLSTMNNNNIEAVANIALNALSRTERARLLERMCSLQAAILERMATANLPLEQS